MKTTSVRPLAPTLPLLAAAAGLLAAGLPTPAALAAIVVAPTATTTGSLTITAPIFFTINNAGTVFTNFILDEYVTTSDGSLTNSAFSPSLSFSLNGTPRSAAGSSLVDNQASTIGSLTPNDGRLRLNNSYTVAPGDSVTLDAGAYSLAAVASFNPQASQTFTGNMFLVNDSGVRVSDIVSAGAVPEPSTYALALLGGLGLIGVARRQGRAGRLRV